ncbi:MAG: alpha-amylase family glycosyl hydrolase [Fusobacteriaceae bacterium]
MKKIIGIIFIFIFSLISLGIDRDEQIKNLKIYQIMVEAYRDTDGKGYGVGYGPSSHLGDLNGITESLDYIKSLGINAIWLTPIFKSESVSPKLAATGYFADNHFEIDPKFGTEKDFKRLVDEAHKREIYVFLDGVFGHKGKVPIDGVKDGPPQADGYEVKYPESLEYFKKVAAYWIEKYGIDGWRVDQAYQMVQKGHNYLGDIEKAVHEVSDKRKTAGEKWGTLGYMVGEIWDGGGKKVYYQGYMGGLKSYFDFTTRYTLLQILATQERTNESWAKNQPAKKLNEYGFNFHELYGANTYPNFFITNHDLVRLGNLIDRGGFSHYWERHKIALSFLSVYTGPVTLYYGDEYGAKLPGYFKEKDLGYYDDHVSRDNGRIDGFSSQEKELIEFTRTLLKLRDENSSMYRGERKNILATNKEYADLKIDGDNVILYAVNFDDKKAAQLKLKDPMLKGKVFVNLLDSKEVLMGNEEGEINLNLGEVEFGLYKMK